MRLHPLMVNFACHRVKKKWTGAFTGKSVGSGLVIVRILWKGFVSNVSINTGRGSICAGNAVSVQVLSVCLLRSIADKNPVSAQMTISWSFSASSAMEIGRIGTITGLHVLAIWYIQSAVGTTRRHHSLARVVAFGRYAKMRSICASGMEEQAPNVTQLCVNSTSAGNAAWLFARSHACLHVMKVFHTASMGQSRRAPHARLTAPILQAMPCSAIQVRSAMGTSLVGVTNQRMVQIATEDVSGRSMHVEVTRSGSVGRWRKARRCQ